MRKSRIGTIRKTLGFLVFIVGAGFVLLLDWELYALAFLTGFGIRGFVFRTQLRNLADDFAAMPDMPPEVASVLRDIGREVSY